MSALLKCVHVDLVAELLLIIIKRPHSTCSNLHHCEALSTLDFFFLHTQIMQSTTYIVVSFSSFPVHSIAS